MKETNFDHSDQLNYDHVPEIGKPKLNSQFRTLLGSKTDYGKAYSKEDLKRSIVEFLSSYTTNTKNIYIGARKISDGKQIFLGPKSESYAYHISTRIPDSEFRRLKGDTMSIDEFENKQLVFIDQAINDRLKEIDYELERVKDGNYKEELEREKLLISKLLE